MNSLVHIDNKGRDILILGKRSTQGLNETILTAEAQYLIIQIIQYSILCKPAL